MSTPMPAPAADDAADPILKLQQRISETLSHLGNSTSQLREQARTTRLVHAQNLHRRFNRYIDTFLDRRAELASGMTPQRRRTVEREYRTLQRNLAQAWHHARPAYQRFMREAPEYDRPYGSRHVDSDPYPRRHRITDWWEPLTFDAALDHWANADDDHLRPRIEHERAILEAFEDWAGTPF